MEKFLTEIDDLDKLRKEGKIDIFYQHTAFLAALRQQSKTLESIAEILRNLILCVSKLESTELVRIKTDDIPRRNL